MKSSRASSVAETDVLAGSVCADALLPQAAMLATSIAARPALHQAKARRKLGIGRVTKSAPWAS